jgi:hypothetical protein
MIVMNKVGQKVICILTGLVIMASPVLGTVNASVFDPHGNFSKNGIDDLPWAKFKNIADNYADDLGKLGKKELNYLKELSDHAGKLDNAILKNLELPAGRTFTEMPVEKIDNILDSAKRFDTEIDIKHIEDNFGEDVFKNVDDLDDAIGYGKIEPCLVGRNTGIIDLLIPVAYACGARPSWRQSEVDAQTRGLVLESAKIQQSYKMGPEGKYIEGKWGDAGSVRPDYYDDISNTVYEVKNYDMNKNLSGLKQNISQQIQNRKNIFGEGVEQIYILDIRGQSLIKTQQQLMNELVESTGLSPDSIKFIYKNI